MNFNVGEGVIKAEEWEWEGIRPSSTFTAECYTKRCASDLRVLKETSIIQCQFSQPTFYSNSVSGQILANMFPGNTVSMYLSGKKCYYVLSKGLCMCVCACIKFSLLRVAIHTIFRNLKYIQTKMNSY